MAPPNTPVRPHGMTPDESYERGLARIDAGDWDGGLPDLAVAIDHRGGPFASERSEAWARTQLRRRFVSAQVLAAGLERHAAAVATGDSDEIRRTAFGAFLSFFFDRDLIVGCRFAADEVEPELAARSGELGIVAESREEISRKLERACLLCLDHQLAVGRGAFAALTRFDRLPVRVDLEAVDRFISLVASDESAWLTLDGALDVAAWQNSRFTAWEAYVWRDFEPAVARAFADQGFEPPEAQTWSRLGFDASAADSWRELELEAAASADWRARRFDLAETRAWRKVDARAEVAQSWRDAGYTPDDFRQLARNVLCPLDLAAAQLWKSKGFETEAVLAWLSNSVFDPGVAARHRELGETPDSVLQQLEREEGEDLAEWRARSFAAVERARWKPLGLSPEEAQRWRSTGMSPREAAAWVEAGIDPVVASGWQHSDAPQRDALEVARLGLPISRGQPFLESAVRSAWLSAGFTLAEAVEWKRNHIEPELAAAWSRVQFRPDEARSLIRAEVSPTLAAEWRDCGAQAAHEIINWTRTGLVPEQGATAITRGIGPGSLYGLVEQMGASNVAAWLAAGAAVETIRAWASTGTSLAEAQELERAGVVDPVYVGQCLREHDQEALLAWAAHGFVSRERSMLGWPERGFDPEAAGPWSRRFFTPQSARQLADGGHRPQDLVLIDRDDPSWLETLRSLAGRPVDEREGRELLVVFANQGYLPHWTLERAVPWLALGFDGAARGWAAHGFGPDESKRWIELGFTRPKYAADAQAQGQTLEKLEAEANSSGVGESDSS